MEKTRCITSPRTASSPLILCMPHCDVLGHAGRTLRLATGLRSALPDYRIEFAGSGLCAPIIERAGFRVHPVVEFLQQDWKQVEDAARTHRAMVRSAGQVRRFVEEELDLFETLRPSVVIGDHRYTLFTSTQVARVPFVSITNAFYTRYSSLRVGAPKALFPVYHHHPALALFHPLVATLVGPLVPHFIRYLGRLHCTPYDVVRREYGLEPHRDLFDFYSGDHVILPDWPEICPTRSLPASYHYVGMFGWTPPPELPPQIDAAGEMIYVTLGSTGRPEEFAKLLSGLGSFRDRQVVVTTGPCFGRDALGALPANVAVHRFLPGNEVLERAVLAVHHGGMGILGQCLTAGVPMVCIPGNVEQEVMARQFVHRHGLGVVVERYRLTPRKVEKAVRTVLEDPRYARNVRAFARRLRPLDPLGTAVEKVRELATDRAFTEAVRRGAWRRV